MAPALSLSSKQDYVMHETVAVVPIIMLTARSEKADRTISVHMRYLRPKLGEASKLIRNFHGIR